MVQAFIPRSLAAGPRFGPPWPPPPCTRRPYAASASTAAATPPLRRQRLDRRGYAAHASIPPPLRGQRLNLRRVPVRPWLDRHDIRLRGLPQRHSRDRRPC
jgi:hypothetical protein